MQTFADKSKQEALKNDLVEALKRKQLPPLLMFAGNDEMFRDDAIRFAEKAKAAGVDVKLTVSEGQIHCYPLLPDFIPESKQAMDDIFAFMRLHLSKTVFAA